MANVRILQNCDNVPYVLKTDDDVFVNVRNLLKFVVDNRKPNLLIGTLQCGAVPIRVSLAASQSQRNISRKSSLLSAAGPAQ